MEVQTTQTTPTPPTPPLPPPLPPPLKEGLDLDAKLSTEQRRELERFRSRKHFVPANRLAWEFIQRYYRQDRRVFSRADEWGITQTKTESQNKSAHELMVLLLKAVYDRGLVRLGGWRVCMDTLDELFAQTQSYSGSLGRSRRGNDTQVRVDTPKSGYRITTPLEKAVAANNRPLAVFQGPKVQEMRSWKRTQMEALTAAIHDKSVPPGSFDAATRAQLQADALSRVRVLEVIRELRRSERPLIGEAYEIPPPRGQGDWLHEAWKRKYERSRCWKAKREIVFKRAGYKCEIPGCGGPAQECHHKTYNFEGSERNGDLQALCKPCHDKQPGGRHGKGAKRDDAGSYPDGDDA